MQKLTLIAIAGPTASGKSTLASRLAKALGKRKAAIISQDNYYKDYSYLSLKQRKQINFDRFSAFDIALLCRHLARLKKGKPIDMPLYDFIQSKRLKKTKKVIPSPYVIVEGLMPFFSRCLGQLFDYKIYILAPHWLCLSRRITRDIKKRGETISSVCKRYFEDVLPMQRRYVQPQQSLADIVVDGVRAFDKRLVAALLKNARASHKI